MKCRKEVILILIVISLIDYVTSAKEAWLLAYQGHMKHVNDEFPYKLKSEHYERKPETEVDLSGDRKQYHFGLPIEGLIERHIPIDFSRQIGEPNEWIDEMNQANKSSDD